jgi:glycosyltransferase involved in cell wall biosynthesis
LEKPTVILVGTSWPFRGGLAAFNERLMREFQREGFTVYIVTFTLQYPGILFPGKTQYADWQAPDDITILRKVSSINPLSWIRAGRWIRKMKPDILLFKYWLPFMGPCFGAIARRSKKNRHTKVVTILDNIIPHEHRIGDALFTRYFIKPVDAFVAMSDAVLKDIDHFNKIKPRAICPHPLFDNFGEKVEKNKARKYLDLEPDGPYVLFFGFIREYKGLDLLLKAFCQEPLKQSSIKLLIAGEFYSNPDPYLKLIREGGLEERVVLRQDFIPDHEVKFYFSACELVVQPYKSATQSGISQIAYHFDKPMIVTNVGGLPEMVPDGKVGFVVNKDPSEIAHSIRKFFDDALETRFSEAIKQEKTRYSWKSMVNTIITLTDQL